MSQTVVFDNPDVLSIVCGVNDSNVAYLENLLDSSIFVRGDSLTLDSQDEEKNQLFTSLISRLSKLASLTQVVSESEMFMEYQSIVSSIKTVLPNMPEPEEEEVGTLSLSLGTKMIFPKSRTQKKYLKALKSSQITFGIGPAGTGKTFLAVAYSLSQIISGKKQKLILTRPVVEAGESLGFLPGDLAQKLNPYLKPLYDSMEYMISPQMIKRLEDSNMIEIAPLAYMRGRSLHHSCIILDEAQNTTTEQMKMFLTRLGEDSTAIITGDITQTDLPRNKVSGLVHAISILDGIESISFVNFHSSDVVRSRIVQRIVDAYERNR